MPSLSRQAEAVLQLCLVVSLTVYAPPRALAQDDERAAIRSTVEKFFAAEARRDLVALMSLWSESSPDLISFRRSSERDYASQGAPRVLRYDFGPLALEAGSARRERFSSTWRGWWGPGGGGVARRSSGAITKRACAYTGWQMRSRETFR